MSKIEFSSSDYILDNDSGSTMVRTWKVVEDRREQILDAAMRVFAQKGFVRATNKDIAREAGITPGLIYHYFENKEAVLRAIIEERSPVNLLKTLPSQVLDLPPEVFLRFLLQQVLRFVEHENFVQLVHVFLPEVIHNPELAPTAINMFQQVLDFLVNYFTARMDSGELRRVDASLTVHIFISCVMGFVLRRRVIRDPVVLQYTHEQLVDAIVTTVLQGLLPR